VKAAEYSIQSAQASMKEARENLLKTTIYAPVSGTISKLSVERGERVVGTSQMAGTELMRIANLNNMEVRVNVNENDIIRLSLGDSVIIDVDSYSEKEQKFYGKVTSIANTAKDAMTLEAVTEFEVRIRILNESYKHLVKQKKAVSPFRPGMTASVEIITERKNNALRVPLAAVTTRTEEQLKETGEKDSKSGPEKKEKKTENKETAAGKTDEIKEVVFVNDNGKARMVEVKTGISDMDFIEILSGLKKGDEVITGPFRAVSKQLKNGLAIQPKSEASLDKTLIAADEDQEEE
ncbi:MAG: HlyD family efflux transporter periplasmic adaptor subunit, partial [Sphingobacteriales bacterium]